MAMNAGTQSGGVITTQLNPFVELIIHTANDKAIHGEYSDAIMLFDEALQIHDAPHIHHYKGTVYDMMGKFNEAIECYDKALECDSSNAEVWYNKGMALKKNGCDEEGSDCIQKGIALALGN